MLPFGPRSPISAPEQAWLNDRAQWLVQSLGERRLLETTIIVPSHSLFELEDRRAIFDRVAELLQMDTRDDVVVFRDQPMPTHSAQLIDLQSEVFESTEDQRNFVVPLNFESDAMHVAAASARQVAHHFLLERKFTTIEAADLGYLADLLTVFFGLGICTANTVLVESSSPIPYPEDNIPWSIQRHGHMTMPMFGYALAWFASRRRDWQPVWTKHLRPDVRHAFKQTIRLLRG